MKIIPAIDLIDGKCVRLTKGDYSTKKIYNADPVEVAKNFEAHGIKYVHIVDLDGAKAKQIINYKTLENIATQTNLHIDFGGGIKRTEDIKIAFEAGAKQITGGSIAVKNRTLFLEWLATYGADKIILGADCKNQKVATNGWLETSDLEVVEFIDFYQQKGIQQVICTDIAKDGMLQGPSTALYQTILKNTAVQLVASGGISSVQDVQKMQEIGCAGTIIGKAIYEGNISLKDLEIFA